MSMHLYSKSAVDIVFGEGPLGFIIGKNDDDFSLIKKFDTKEDGTRLPLEGCGAVHKGDIIIAVNGESVSFLGPRDVKGKLKKSGRPMTVRFARPCHKSHFKTVSTAEGEKRIQIWSEEDWFLPIRSYRLDGMSEMFITQRDSEDRIQRALTPIYRNGPIFECEVREAAYNGISTQQDRTNIWKMLLRSYPYQPSKWDDKRKENLDTYNLFVNEFIILKNNSYGKEACDIVPNPIDSSWKRSVDYNPIDDDGNTNESKWSRSFGDGEMREIIWKDTQRTYSDMSFFSVYNKDVLARLLYVFGKLNHGVQYVQGMNELLAPLLYVFAQAEKGEKGEGEIEGNDDEGMNYEVSREVEADAFFSFNNLMAETKDLFIQQMDGSTTGLKGVLAQLHDVLETQVPLAAGHLNHLQVDPQFYAVRWLTTLFAREFHLSHTFRIWDSLLADPSRFLFMHCIGAAMIQLVEEQLLQADFAGIMHLLQTYETPLMEDLLTCADEIRTAQLCPRKIIDDDDKKGIDLKKISSDLAGEVGDQMKKGWSLMKTKGLPFLTKIAQDTKTKVVSMSESVSQKMKERKEEEEKEEEEKEEEEEEGKKKKKKKKESENDGEKKKKTKTVGKKGKKTLGKSRKVEMEEEEEESEEKPVNKKGKKKEESEISEEESGEDGEVAYL